MNYRKNIYRIGSHLNDNYTLAVFTVILRKAVFYYTSCSFPSFFLSFVLMTYFFYSAACPRWKFYLICLILSRWMVDFCLLRSTSKSDTVFLKPRVLFKLKSFKVLTLIPIVQQRGLPTSLENLKIVFSTGDVPHIRISICQLEACVPRKLIQVNHSISIQFRRRQCRTKCMSGANNNRLNLH